MRKLILLENVTEKQYSPLGEVVDKGILGWCFFTIITYGFGLFGEKNKYPCSFPGAADATSFSLSEKIFESYFVDCNGAPWMYSCRPS